MGAIASQITSLTIVYSTVYSDADPRIHQSSASLPCLRRIHWGPVNSPHKWQVTRKIFSFDNIITLVQMLSKKKTNLVQKPANRLPCQADYIAMNDVNFQNLFSSFGWHPIDIFWHTSYCIVLLLKLNYEVFKSTWKKIIRGQENETKLYNWIGKLYQ